MRLIMEMWLGNIFKWFYVSFLTGSLRASSFPDDIRREPETKAAKMQQLSHQSRWSSDRRMLRNTRRINFPNPELQVNRLNRPGNRESKGANISQARNL